MGVGPRKLRCSGSRLGADLLLPIEYKWRPSVAAGLRVGVVHGGGVTRAERVGATLTVVDEFQLARVYAHQVPR